MKLKMKELYINETKMSKKEYDIFIKVDDQKFGFREDLYTIMYISLLLYLFIHFIVNEPSIYPLGILLYWFPFLYKWRKLFDRRKVENKNRLRLI